MSFPEGPRRPPVAQMIEWVYRPTQLLARNVEKYGDNFTMRLPRLGTAVFLSEPAAIKQVFTEKPDVLLAGKANVVLEPLLGPHSLLLLDGPEHLRRRRLLLPPFHGERMAAYGQLMREITLSSLSRWPVGVPFALHPFMREITLEVILRAVFGLEEGAQMRSLAALLTQYFTPPPFILAFLPQLWIDFPGSPYRTFIRTRDEVDKALYAIIAERRRAPDRDARTDIFSLLLAARDEEGNGLTDVELRDELLTLLAAGHETTATALSWAFERILDTPAVEERLLAELRESGGATDPAGLQKLHYLDATLKETLRLRPILPIVAREVQVDEYQIAGYKIPRGTILAPCIFLAHRRPEMYPDPLRFWPERFLDGKPDPYAWLPFGGGIRRCIGMAFANYEMAIVLATVLSAVKLSREPGAVPIMRRSITLAPQGGTRVILKERLATPARAA